VFSILGKGHWLFIGAVSLRWRVLLQQLQYGTGDNKASRESMTWYGAALASVTCLEYSLAHGLNIQDSVKEDGTNVFCLDAGRCVVHTILACCVYATSTSHTCCKLQYCILNRVPSFAGVYFTANLTHSSIATKCITNCAGVLI
jgi:hypothetical protein